jgi:hypothetical protein
LSASAGWRLDRQGRRCQAIMVLSVCAGRWQRMRDLNPRGAINPKTISRPTAHVHRRSSEVFVLLRAPDDLRRTCWYRPAPPAFGLRAAGRLVPAAETSTAQLRIRRRAG